MATHRLSILGASLNLGPVGVSIEPYTIAATNDFWTQLVIKFADTSTDDWIQGTFNIPANYISAPKWYIVWTSTATSGNAVWEMGYRVVSGDDSASLDQATAQETQTVTDAAPTAAHNRLNPTISPTAGNFSAGATVEFKFLRKGTSGSETMAAAAYLFDVQFEYADA